MRHVRRDKDYVVLLYGDHLVADANRCPPGEYVLLVFDRIGVVGHAAARLHVEAAHREVGSLVGTEQHLS